MNARSRIGMVGFVAVLVAGCSSDTDETAAAAADSAAATFGDITDTADSAAATLGDITETANPDTSSSDDIDDRTAADRCRNEGTPGATSTCLKPMHPADYYASEASRYFDTLDVDADPDSMPDYSELVARWEWPPWLLLTGYGKEDMINTSKLLKVGDPSTVPDRDCRFFETQPFARCYVVFEYEDGPCPIYEEFTFNDAGEMTFIEAWSDLPGLRPHTAGDRWARTEGFARLSTRVPGLGSPNGELALGTSFMIDAAASDPELADFAERTTDWWAYWSQALNDADTDFFAKGCGW